MRSSSLTRDQTQGHHWEPRVLATRPPRKPLVNHTFLSQDTIPVPALADDYNLDFNTYLTTIKSFLWQALGTRGHLTCPKGFTGEWEQQRYLKRERTPLHPRPLHPAGPDALDRDDEITFLWGLGFPLTSQESLPNLPRDPPATGAQELTKNFQPNFLKSKPSQVTG